MRRKTGPNNTYLQDRQPCPPHAPLGLEANCPVGSNSMGAAVRVNTGRRRAACGTMSVRAVRCLTSSTRTTAPHRRVRDAGLNPRRSVWPSRCGR